MTYSFQLPESVPDGIRRMAGEQVEKALGNLVRPVEDPDGAIHDTRKRFKKVRALLRLVRKELGSDVYSPENREYRDLGRLLGPVRKSAVLSGTVAMVAEGFDEVFRDRAFHRFLSRLEERHEEVLADVLRPGGPVARIREEGRKARKRIASWPLEDRDFETMKASLRKVYKRGRNRMEDAYADPTGPRYHEWRKRVKYLWYHHRILAPVWNEVLDARADALHDLADLLGDGNDLTDLLVLLGEESHLVPSDGVREALAGRAERRRDLLWEEARPLGLKIYQETPDEFVDRMEGYWEVGVREAG
jgi:CHAD domain-containing protein